MDGISPTQPLTEANLGRLQDVQRGKLPSESLTSSDFLPIDKLEKAKRKVYQFLLELNYLGPEGERIREAEDVYITGASEVCYRGNTIPEPDLEDSNFWEAKLEHMIREHGPCMKLAREKHGVYHMMTVLRDYGREGRKILADYELYIAGKDDVRYRGNDDSKPDLQDPAYWVAQYEYLRSKHQPLWKARYPRPPPKVYKPPNTEQRAKIAELNKSLTKTDPLASLEAWSKRKREIKAWSNAQHADSSPLRVESSTFNDPPGQSTAGDVEDRISHRSLDMPHARWGDAYRGVYERMTDLWHVGGKGRELVRNDELRIVGRYDVRYRRSRGPKPDLKDPSYWEAKWAYFTDEYISLARDAQHSSQILAQLASSPGHLPNPCPSSGVRSPTPSSVESLGPSPELVQAEELRKAKKTLYDVISCQFYQEEGRKILEDDDVYIAGENDVRYKHTVGPEPDLQNPRYWLDKAKYFYNQFVASFPTDEEYAEQLRHERAGGTRGQLDPPSESTWYSTQPPLRRPAPATRDATPLLDLEDQLQAPTAMPLEYQSTPACDSMDKENCAPNPDRPITQATKIPRTPKRKRGSNSDDTDQSSHPSKRSKSGTGHAGSIRSTATGSSPAEALSTQTPTPEVIMRQLHASDPGPSRGVTRTSVPPILVEVEDRPLLIDELETRPVIAEGLANRPMAIEELGDRPTLVEEPEDEAMPAPPQRRKRQRKTYEKERTSRRLAGQLPEFGLLPEQGEEPQPYKAPTRRAATTNKMDCLRPRSERISKKPAPTKSTKSRATPKPTNGGAGPRTRSRTKSKRN
ncbi:hypothetical protein FHL15_000494 [Xylaria flabelliformis]|uniref:Uncharacterized protein n=1 Tax=Xylaria flabelliformis TaxID=2512241 RepID=A0A553IE05_9PEZI|nr:hypothetical protein FHL15_000494 [Xylaria flabelliformis]